MASAVISHVYDFTHGRIVGKLEVGYFAWNVGNEFGVPKSEVARLWKQFSENGSAARRYRSLVLTLWYLYHTKQHHKKNNLWL